MYSTGPLFLSVLWKQYMASGKNVGDGIDGGRVRVMMEEEYQRFPWSFFTQFVGSSWHEGDARAIVWVGDNIGQVIAGGVVSALTLMGVLWWLFSVVRRRSWLKGQSKHHYDRLPKHEA
jgi:mannosyltransferase OCH1-like enzyme